MKTEIVTTDKDEPVSISWNPSVKLLATKDKWGAAIYYTNQDRIELRDFLNQLDLNKTEEK